MIRNQKGDALTLALGASVFVAISIMVIIAVLSNMDSKVQRARMVNEVENTTLYMQQILNNRDLCPYALRNASGTAVNIPVTPPDDSNKSVAISRLYVTQPLSDSAVPPEPPQYCLTGDAACTPIPNMTIRKMSFDYVNSAENNKFIIFRGTTDRYALLSGTMNIDIDFTGSGVLGGDLRTRNFPFQALVDTQADAAAVPPTPAGHIVLCYTRQSLALICIELGGTMDPVSGTCKSMFGKCGVAPNLPPASACTSLPVGNCSAALGLKWTTIYYASTIKSGLQMDCNCLRVCTAGP